MNARVLEFTDPRLVGVGSDFDRWAKRDERLAQRREALRNAFLAEVQQPFDARPSDFIRSGWKYITEVRNLFEVAADRDYKGENGMDKMYATLLLCARKGDVDAVACMNWLADSYAEKFILDGKEAA